MDDYLYIYFSREILKMQGKRGIQSPGLFNNISILNLEAFGDGHVLEGHI